MTAVERKIVHLHLAGARGRRDRERGDASRTATWSSPRRRSSERDRRAARALARGAPRDAGPDGGRRRCRGSARRTSTTRWPRRASDRGRAGRRRRLGRWLARDPARRRAAGPRVSTCSRRSGGSATFLERAAAPLPERPGGLRPRRGARARRGPGCVRRCGRPRAGAARRSRSSGACRSCGPGGRVILCAGASRRSSACRALRRRPARRRPAGACVGASGLASAARCWSCRKARRRPRERFPARPGRGPETSSAPD